jgi:hypothetical protein
MKKYLLLGVLVVITVLSMYPQASSAADNEDWQNNSVFTDAIATLDDNPVEELAIPVLFGVSLQNITPNFGNVRGDGSRTHEGLDMMSITGTPIVSPTQAVVRNTGYGDLAGNYVYTVNPGGEVFAYLHLNEIAQGLETGTILQVGDFIGTVGYSGNAIATNPHLHFEIQIDGESIDPYTRITKEFSSQEKIALFREILDGLSGGDKEYMRLFVDVRFKDEITEPQVTMAKLSDIVIDCTIDYTRLIRLRSRGEDVKQVQRCMNSLGFSTGVVDGIYGPNTYKGITNYQRATGLKYIDGIVGPETSGALNVLGVKLI